VIREPGGRLLLIQRGHEPGAGLWSLPGGHVEPGETNEQAVARECLEETGLRVVCGRLLGAVELPGPAGAISDVRDYLADVVGGELAAGDDAAAVRWVRRDEMAGLPLTRGLAGILASWGVWDG
jgi:8-oxo-dGTP diphosphatase